MSGYVLPPGPSQAFGFHGSTVVIKASGDRTLGQLAVMESGYPAGLSVHAHVHDGEDEMLYLLAGELTAHAGPRKLVCGFRGAILREHGARRDHGNLSAAGAWARVREAGAWSSQWMLSRGCRMPVQPAPDRGQARDHDAPGTTRPLS
jgi:hypothetical protein